MASIFVPYLKPHPIINTIRLIIMRWIPLLAIKTFKNLIDEAHKRGIRIMFDAVFNHMGVHSPQWQDVLKNGENRSIKTGSTSVFPSRFLSDD